MENLQDWNNTNLEDYLLEATWQPHRAMYLLAGYMVDDDTLPDDYDGVTAASAKICGRLSNLWRSKGGIYNFYDEPLSPTYFIGWALTKKFRPDWVDWAIARKLYEPELSAPTVTNTDTTTAPNTLPKQATADVVPSNSPSQHEGSIPATETPEASKNFTTYPELELVTRSTVTTAEAAFYLNRSPQTLRAWASLENGPLRPVRINGKLAWSVSSIKALLIGNPA